MHASRARGGVKGGGAGIARSRVLRGSRRRASLSVAVWVRAEREHGAVVDRRGAQPSVLLCLPGTARIYAASLRDVSHRLLRRPSSTSTVSRTYFVVN